MAYILERVGSKSSRTGGYETEAIGKTVQGPELRIGRAADADVHFTERAVALEHAVIRAHEDGYELIDRGSATGTYLNGKPVSRAVLKDQDWLEIGRHRLVVRISGPGVPMRLEIEQLETERQVAEAGEVAVKVSSSDIDYEARYSLKRGLISRSFLSLVLVVTAVVAFFMIGVAGRTDVFRPGMVSEAHLQIADDCNACHVSWQGTPDHLCTDCHSGPEHNPRQASNPECKSCHTEHRFVPLLAKIDNGKCSDCHADLEIAGDGKPLFAENVTDFAEDHPEFSITIMAGGIERRARLDEPNVLNGDRSRTALNHELHLRADLKGPQGPTQLDCFSCHTLSRVGEIEPVNYEKHCGECHQLTYDPRFPPAPHESPENLHALLLRRYSENPDLAAVPLQEQRRRLPRSQSTQPRVLDLDERVLGEVVRAEYNLYRSACTKCHEVDLEQVPPAVISPNIPTQWYRHATFTHRKHRMLECVGCHEGSPTSRRTADVSLPGIQNCLECHNGDGLSTAGSATTQCISCHYFHEKTRNDSWEAPSGLVRTTEASAGLGQ